MGTHNPRNQWFPYFIGSAAETYVAGSTWATSTIQNNYKHHICRVCCTSEVLSIMFKRAFCDTSEIEKFYPHSQSLLGNRAALSPAKAQLPCSFDSIQIQLSFFWWYSYNFAAVQYCRSAVLLVIPGSQQPQSLALSSWPGEGAPGSPFLQLFSGTNSVWVTFWFWKIFCCVYFLSKSLIAQVNSCLAQGLVFVQQLHNVYTGVQ